MTPAELKTATARHLRVLGRGATLGADDSAIPGWLDWAAQHPSEANGGILLMHGRHGTIEAMPGWLDQLAALGLQPATLGETLR